MAPTSIHSSGLSKLSDNLRKKVEDVKRKVPEFQRRKKEIFMDEIEKALQEAAVEFGERQQEVMEREFFSAVTAFYNTYHPKYYEREGDTSTHTGGLYDLLNLEKDVWGRVSYASYDDLLDQSQMTLDRRGNNLYNKVFVQGWHGGAEGGEGHPNPGVPYWRTPQGQYYNWGRRAKRAKTPPYERFIKQIYAAERGELSNEFHDIQQRYVDEAMERTKQRVPQLISEIFGQYGQ